MMVWSETEGAKSLHYNKAVVVNATSQEMLLADLGERLAAGKGFVLATLNLDHVTKIRRDPVFREAYRRHSHVTADGNPIVWFSRLAGQDVSLVPGCELIEPLTAKAAKAGRSIALFGTSQASLDEAATALKQRHPGLEVSAMIAPPMGFDPQSVQADAYIDSLKKSGAGICFVALGAPKQEVFAIRASERLPQMGFASIGAGLDFISGRQRRAPLLVRRLKAEWLWRLLGNPRRLARRYGECIAILPSLLGIALKIRQQARRSAVK